MVFQFRLQISDFLQSGVDFRVVVVTPESAAFVAALDGVFVELRKEIGVDVADADEDGVEGVANERRRDGIEDGRSGGGKSEFEAGEGRGDGDKVEDGT